jgi:hypothetical protein
MDSSTMAVVQDELLPSETVLWSGQPSSSVIFHRQDGYLIPFSLMWGGFAIFWESMASAIAAPRHGHAAPGFFLLWGIPFVVIGQYLIWGRFLYDAWLKKRTYYAVTNKRVIALQNGFSHRTVSSNLDSLTVVVEEGGSNGTGTLRFGAQPNWNTRGWGMWNLMTLTDTPTFVDIPDLDTVYRTVSNLCEAPKA